jgi:hypothetical protein
MGNALGNSTIPPFRAPVQWVAPSDSTKVWPSNALEPLTPPYHGLVKDQRREEREWERLS